MAKYSTGRTNLSIENVVAFLTCLKPLTRYDRPTSQPASAINKHAAGKTHQYSAPLPPSAVVVNNNNNQSQWQIAAFSTAEKSFWYLWDPLGDFHQQQFEPYIFLVIPPHWGAEQTHATFNLHFMAFIFGSDPNFVNRPESLELKLPDSLARKINRQFYHPLV